MTPSRSARAFFSTSLLACLVLGFAPSGAAAAGSSRADSLPPLARLRAAEFEAALAKGKAIYLVLDPVGKRLAVKSRGLELAAVALDDVALLDFRPWLGRGTAPELVAPAVWKITAGPGDADRETIAPPVLKPYESEEEEEPEPAPAAAAAPTPEKKKPDEVARPSSYRVVLENGWQLFVTPEAPRAGLFRRLGAAVQDGWLRLKGQEPPHPPLVALVMPKESAERLHHLFRTGNEILVLP